MTMVPAGNLLQYSGYGGSFYTRDTNCSSSTTYKAPPSDLVADVGVLGSDFASAGHMAEDESRATSFNEAAASSFMQVRQDVHEGDAEANTEARDESWLQLGLGGPASREEEERSGAGAPQPRLMDFFSPRQQPPSTLQYAGEGSSGGASVVAAGPPLFFQQPMTSLSLRPEMGWAGPSSLGLWNHPMAAASPSFMPFYSQQPFMRGPPPSFGSDAAGPSSGLRIVDAPRRPQSGIWFALRSSPNQERETALPQIRKSYLRIKDRGMTVRLLMKYLANKLGLDDESEVEITCKGQQLAPLMTLQYVRDNIWCSRDAITLVPDSTSTTEHVVMILCYSRRFLRES